MHISLIDRQIGRKMKFTLSIDLAKNFSIITERTTDEKIRQ